MTRERSAQWIIVSDYFRGQAVDHVHDVHFHQLVGGRDAGQVFKLVPLGSGMGGCVFACLIVRLLIRIRHKGKFTWGNHSLRWEEKKKKKKKKKKKEATLT